MGYTQPRPAATQLRLSAGINVPILLVFESVFRVASMGTYNEYAPMDAPWKRIQIRRNIGTFIPADSLMHCVTSFTRPNLTFFISNEHIHHMHRRMCLVCRRIQILRNPVYLFFSCPLTFGPYSTFVAVWAPGWTMSYPQTASYGPAWVCSAFASDVSTLPRPWAGAQSTRLIG
jgi:hypothetical protein